MIARIALQRFRLPLRRALRTARGSIAAREGVLLELTSARGARGYGEAMPLAGWPGEPLDTAHAWLASAAPDLLGLPAADALAKRSDGPPLARAGLETALLDLAARERGVPLAELLGDTPPCARVAVNALIDYDAPEAIGEQARAAASRGFRAFKLKLGTQPFARDLDRVAALRDAIGTDAALRLDANGAWSEEEAAGALAALERFAPEYVEEPASGIDACARLRRRTRVAIALDESACDRASIERALRERAADVLVLKLPLLGGPLAARDAALRARDAGVGAVITSFLDSALGVAAGLHCAAALPSCERASGLATGALLASDLACLAPNGGWLHVPAGAGLGVVPSAAALELAAIGPRWECAA